VAFVVDRIAQRSSRDRSEIIDIVYLYQYYARMADLNPYALLAQAMHETGWLTSWWSQPPRRNLAGLGVNGSITCTRPSALSRYTYDPRISCWRRGYSYQTWDDAVRSHVAWVLYYVVASPTPQQQLLLDTIGKSHGIDRVQIVHDFNGLWAVPGTTYGDALEAIMCVLGVCS
jgi:hypothetical protein